MKIDTGEKNLHGFELRTNAVQALTRLVYAWKDIGKFIRLAFNSEGMYMSELACDGSAWVYVTLRGELIKSLDGIYNCTGPGIICLEAELLWKLLSKQGAEDEFHVRYDHKAKKKLFPGLRDKYEVLHISIIHGSNGSVMEYEVPILNGSRKIYTSDTEKINFFSALNSDLLNTFINVNCDESFDTKVEISVCDLGVQIEKLGDTSVISSARLGALTLAGKENNVNMHERHVFPGAVKKTFFLSHLDEIKKFLNVTPNGMLGMYTKRDPENYPIIFEIKIGGIGQVVVALSPVIEEE